MDIGSKIYNILDKLTKRNEYSTEERIVGKWIDGKPIYRKVIRTNVSAAGQFGINTGIINFSTLVDLRTFLIINNDYYAYFKPLDLSMRSNGNMYITNTESAAFQRILVIIEYTKTTD